MRTSKRIYGFISLAMLVSIEALKPSAVNAQTIERVDIHYKNASDVANLINALLVEPKPEANPQGKGAGAESSQNQAMTAETSPKMEESMPSMGIGNTPSKSMSSMGIANTTSDPTIIFLKGSSDQIQKAQRIIALVDAPSPSVKMELWGIQLTGNSPRKLSEASSKIRNEVDLTQAAIKGTFYRLQNLVYQATENADKSRFYATVQFPNSFKEGSREYSLQELIIRLVALGDPSDPLDLSSENSYTAIKKLARSLSKLWLSNDLYRDNLVLFTKKYRKSIADINFQNASNINWAEQYIPESGVQPFERFFHLMGVRPLCQLNPKNDDQLLCDWVPAVFSAKEAYTKFTCIPDEYLLNCQPRDPKDEIKIGKQNIITSKSIDTNCLNREYYPQYSDQNACKIRNRIAKFANNYHKSTGNGSGFDGKDLKLSADQLNSHLEILTRAINLDIEKFFINPLLTRTEKIASSYGGIQYSNVGRASISTINGNQSTLKATASNVFDVTTTPTLSQLLQGSNNLNTNIGGFFPNAQAFSTLIKGLGVNLTIPQVIGLIGAFGEQKRELRELYTGINLTITPRVLRDLRSAELDINLVIPDPASQGSIIGSTDAMTASTSIGLDNLSAAKRPFSRLTQQQIQTKIYTDAIDFFAFSTFNNQTTMPGAPFVVPVLGHVWKGIFGAIPVFGDLFQFPTGNRKVYNESILMTTTFITPTPYGLAALLDEKTSQTDASSQSRPALDPSFFPQLPAIQPGLPQRY